MSASTRRRPTGAGRTALRAYRGLPLVDRLHATVRWWSAPFPAVEELVPRTGRILEIGCGHGLFCTYLALADGRRTVRGSDIDVPKIEQARAVANQLKDVDLQFDVATSGAVATGPWDAIVIIDMLYLLPAAEQQQLLAAAVPQLGPGGVLLVKEMAASPRWKASWNVFQETVSVAILGITERADSQGRGQESARFDFVAPGVMAGWLADLGLTTSFRSSTDTACIRTTC